MLIGTKLDSDRVHVKRGHTTEKKCHGEASAGNTVNYEVLISREGTTSQNLAMETGNHDLSLGSQLANDHFVKKAYTISEYGNGSASVGNHGLPTGS